MSLQGNNGCLSNDFESLVMRRLRQEEERKRLIAEMEREDREGEGGGGGGGAAGAGEEGGGPQGAPLGRSPAPFIYLFKM